jgi:hypothetical protein
MSDTGTDLAVVDGGASTELAQLAELSVDDGSAYWEGPHAKRLQVRRVELLAARDAAAGVGTEEEAQLPTGPNPARAAFDAMVAQMSPDDRPSFIDGYHALPLETQWSIAVELHNGVPEATNVSWNAVSAFASYPVGSRLAEAWGDVTVENIGRLHARIVRLASTMTRESYLQLADRLKDLSPAQEFFITNALASKRASR